MVYLKLMWGFIIEPMINTRKQEWLFSGTFILFISLYTARAIHQEWLELCHGLCNVQPKASLWTVAHTAPEAYRIALPILYRLVNSTVVDFVCCFLTLMILSRLAVTSAASVKDRALTLVTFLCAVQLPMYFVEFRQRPETLPTALFLAVALYAMTKLSWPWMVLLFISTAAQAFVRADVPFIFGMATVLVGIFKNTRDPLPRRDTILRGVGIFLIAGGIQACLQFVLFPHLPYSTGTPFVYRENLRTGHLKILFLALAPFLCMLPLMRRYRGMKNFEWLAAAASLLYLPLWFTVGVVMEVRIFVPFLLALCVIAARTGAAYLSQEDTKPIHDQTLNSHRESLSFSFDLPPDR